MVCILLKDPTKRGTRKSSFASNLRNSDLLLSTMKPEKVAIATTVFFAASLRLSAAETTVEQTTNHIHHSRPRSLIRKRSNRDQRQLNHIYVQSAKDPSIRFPNSLSSGTGTPKRGQCLDYSSYRSKIGSTCETIRQAGLNCDGFTDLGFTPSETDELKMACPIACGLCTDAAADPDPITISTNSPTIAPSASTKKDSGTSSMGTCFDDSCADDPLYVGKLNIDCATIRSGSFDCTKFGVMSYVSFIKFDGRTFTAIESECSKILRPRSARNMTCSIPIRFCTVRIDKAFTNTCRASYFSLSSSPNDSSG